MRLGLFLSAAYYPWAGAPIAPPSYVPKGVILNPYTTLEWAAGIPDTAQLLINVWVKANVGSPAHHGSGEFAGNTMFSGAIFGSGQATGVNAENVKGSNAVYDNSPNMPFRWNLADSSITPANEATKSHINAAYNNPQDGNDNWVCWTLAADISVISGNNARGAIWRTVLGHAPVKVQDGLPITNPSLTWTNGGTQKINLSNALGFFINGNNALGGSLFEGADFFISYPSSGFLDNSNNLIAGLDKFVTPGGMPVNPNTAIAAGFTPVRLLSGDRAAFMVDKSTNASNPTLVQSTLRSKVYNAPSGPGQVPDTAWIIWTHMDALPTTAVHTYNSGQFFGSEIRQDDGLLLTVRLENANALTSDLAPSVVTASGASYSAVEVPNSRQTINDGSQREMQVVQYLIRMGARDVTAPGTDYAFFPTINWGTSDTLWNTSCWQASLIRYIDWTNGGIDVSQGTTNAGGTPGVGTGFLRCPSVTPTAGKRLMVNTFVVYDAASDLTDAGAPTNSGQELWRSYMTVSGGGPMVTYENLIADGVTATGTRDAQYTGTTMRINVGLSTVFVGLSSTTIVDAPSYPLSVIAADTAKGNTLMRGVWDLRLTAGCRIPQVNLVKSSTVVSWPTGVSRNSSTGAITIVSSVSLSGYDFGTDGLFIINDGTVVSITDCMMAPGTGPGGRIWLGQNFSAVSAGSVTVTFDYITVDLAGGDNTGGHSLIRGFNASTMTIKHSRIFNAPRAMIDWGTASSGPLLIEDTLFGAWATNTDNADHTEVCQFLGGSGTLRRCLLNPSLGLALTPGAVTAPWFWEGTSAIVNGVMEDCIVLCPPVAGLYTFQCKANSNNVNVTCTGSIFERGASGYHDLTATAPNVVTVTNGGHNYDFVAATLIVTL